MRKLRWINGHVISVKEQLVSSDDLSPDKQQFEAMMDGQEIGCFKTRKAAMWFAVTEAKRRKGDLRVGAIDVEEPCPVCGGEIEIWHSTGEEEKWGCEDCDLEFNVPYNRIGTVRD